MRENLLPDSFLKKGELQKNTNFGKMLMTKKIQHTLHERRCFL